jgi:hypothetical protein
LHTVEVKVDGKISLVFKVDEWWVRSDKEKATEILGSILRKKIIGEVEADF